MPTTQAETVSADLLGFIKTWTAPHTHAQKPTRKRNRLGTLPIVVKGNQDIATKSREWLYCRNWIRGGSGP
jgi:hypothetical protein